MGNALPFSNIHYQAQKSYMRPMLCEWQADIAGRKRAMPHIKVRNI